MAVVIPNPRIENGGELLTPGRKPAGNVVIDFGDSLAPDAFVIGGEMIGVGLLRLSSNTSLPETSVINRTLIGREATSNDLDATSSGTLPAYPQRDRSSFNSGTWIFKVTIEADNGGGPKLLYKEGSVTDGVGFFYRTNPDKFSIGTTTTNTDNEIQFATTFTAYEATNEFIILGFKYDGTNWYLYINGVLVETQAVTHNPLSHANRLASLFGEDYGAGSRPCSTTIFMNAFSWYGSLDAFRRNDAALSDAAINSISRNIYQSLIPA